MPSWPSDPTARAAAKRAWRLAGGSATDKPAAAVRRRRWTTDENERVLAHAVSDRELSAQLQRSMTAIQSRRTRLLKLVGEGGMTRPGHFRRNSHSDENTARTPALPTSPLHPSGETSKVRLNSRPGSAVTPRARHHERDQQA